MGLQCIDLRADLDFLCSWAEARPYFLADTSLASVTDRVFDLGGSTQKLWLRYYHKVHGVIWVVDAAEPRSLQESKLARGNRKQREVLGDVAPLVEAHPVEAAVHIRRAHA